MIDNKNLEQNKVKDNFRNITIYKRKNNCFFDIKKRVLSKFKNFINSFKIKTINLLKILKEKLSFFKLDFSFILIFLVGIFIGEIELLFIFIFFIILHELVHYFVAKKLGYLAKNIHLSFFGASLEGLDDFTLSDELKVILSAPFFNLSVVVFCYLCFWFYPESYNYLYEILIVNWSIFLFNMLPIFPLDFGRIILSLASKKFMRKTALKITKTISFIFIIFLFFMSLTSLFFDYNFMLGFASVNLMNMLLKSSTSCSYKREVFAMHKAKLIKRGLMERNIYIDRKTPLYSLFRFIDDYHYVNFYLVDESFEIVNILSELELYKKLGYC